MILTLFALALRWAGQWEPPEGVEPVRVSGAAEDVLMKARADAGARVSCQCTDAAHSMAPTLRRVGVVVCPRLQAASLAEEWVTEDVFRSEQVCPAPRSEREVRPHAPRRGAAARPQEKTADLRAQYDALEAQVCGARAAAAATAVCVTP